MLRAAPMLHSCFDGRPRSLRVGPALAPRQVDLERNLERIGVFHRIADDRLGFDTLLGRRLDKDFVVHLEDEARLEPLFFELGVEADESELEDVSGEALN